MVREKLTKFTLYRSRYFLAYVVFGIALGALLFTAALYVPGGLTDSEINSALVSDNLNPSLLFSLQPEQLVYLPYRLLQAASIALFGLSVLSIKLPSILLGFFSALGILYLLSLWYRRNVAIITATVAVTTNQFLLASQAGQAGISYIFLTTMILIAASMIAHRSAYANIWVVLGFIIAGVSLYMPLNIYILVALIVTSLFHPHARHLLFRQSSKPIVALGVVLFLVIISPLILGIINDLSLLATLTGFSESLSSVVGNASLLISQYSQFYAPKNGAVLVPVYGLGVVMLIFLGLYRLLSAKYTAKSYIISIWLVLLVPLVCLNPTFVSITFIPALLLIALAVEYLIWSWYRLFPHNPYARAFGLLPLAVLMGGLIVSNIDRYVYGFHYDQAVYSSYNFDLQTLEDKLRTLDADTKVTLVVSIHDLTFYTSFVKHQDYITDLTVSTNVVDAANAQVAIVDRSLKSGIAKVPSEILIVRSASQADRFYLYKNS